MKRKRISRLPVPEDAKSTDNKTIKSSKFSRNLGPESTGVLRSETTQIEDTVSVLRSETTQIEDTVCVLRSETTQIEDTVSVLRSETIQIEDTVSSNMYIIEFVKRKPLCSSGGTKSKHLESDNFKQTKSVTVINETTEVSKDIIREQSSNCDTESSTNSLEMSNITEDRVSESGKVSDFPTYADSRPSSIANVEENDVKTARKSAVYSVLGHTAGENFEYLNDLQTDSGRSQEILCFVQGKSKLDTENFMQDAEKVHVVEVKQFAESDKTALQNSPKSMKSSNSFSKGISEMDNNNGDKIMLFDKDTSDFLHARDIEVNGKVESLSNFAMDTADVQKCETKSRKYFTQGTQKLHIDPTSTSAECVNNDETVSDDIRRDQSNMEVKNVDDNSEKLDDDSLPASPFRPAIIDFDTTLPCSPDPQNPMLKNLVESSFCSPLKGSRSRSTTADDKQAVDSMEHLNGLDDIAGKGTSSTQNTEKNAGSDNELIPLLHKHVDDCSVEPRITLPKNGAEMDLSSSFGQNPSSEHLNKAETEKFCDVKVLKDDIMTGDSSDCEGEQINASAGKYKNVVQRDFSAASSNKIYDSSSNRTVNLSRNRASSRNICSCRNSTIGMGNSSMDSSSSKTVSNLCCNEITDKITSVNLSCKDIAEAAEEVSKVNQTLPNEHVTLTAHETRNCSHQKPDTESVSGKNSKEESKDICNNILIDSLNDMVDSVSFLEAGANIMSQPLDFSQNSSTANSALYLDSIDMDTKDTTDSYKACETRTERTGNERTDLKMVTVLQDGCSKIDFVKQDSINCLCLYSKQGQNHSTDVNDQLSESEYCVHNSFDEINKMFENKVGLQLEFNQTKGESLTQENELIENVSFEQNLHHSVDFPYCSCAETQEDSGVPVEQIFVHEGQMYQLSHANIVRFGNLEFYAFLRDSSLHIPLGNFLRVVDKEVKNMFRNAVKFERFQLPCLTLDEMYLLEQKCGVYYDSTNISLISLVTLQEICVLLRNINPDSMTLKMLAFSKPCQRILGSQLKCSACGLAKNGKRLDKTYVQVNPTGDQNPKVEATVGALTIGDKTFTAFELKGKVYMSLKNIFQMKLVKLKTMQNRLKKLNSKTIIAPLEIEEYFCMQGVDVDHTLWIDMVTLRCLICMSQLSTPELIRIAQGEFIYNPCYYLFCGDTSRSDACFEVNSFNGQLIQSSYFKGTCRRLPFILTKGKMSLAKRIQGDSISGYESIDTVIDDIGRINGPRRKYSKIIQTGRIEKNSCRPRRSCRPRKNKTSEMSYYFSENENLLEHDRENENDQNECKERAKKQCQFKVESSGEMKNTSQDSESDGQVILKPGDYIVKNYEKFYEKLDAGYIVGKGNDNKLVHLQSEEKQAANTLESAKDIDILIGTWKENTDMLSNQVQQISDSSYKQGSNLGLNLDFKHLGTHKSAETTNTDDMPVEAVEAKINSAFVEENKTKNSDGMSLEDQGLLNNELKQAVAISNPSSEGSQNFIDRFSTSDFDTVKNLKFCDVSLTPNKSKLNISADSVTECSEEETDFSSVQQLKKSQINEVAEVENFIQFVTGNNCNRPKSISEESLSVEELRKDSVTTKEHLTKANICVQKEGRNDIRSFELHLLERSIANVEGNVLLCSVESSQMTETETEKPNCIKGIDHKQCKQDIEQSEPHVAVTQEKMEEVCNSKEEKDLTLEDGTQENIQNTAENVGLEKCEIELAEIQPGQNTDADRRKEKTVEEMRREMEDNIRKYLVFMYVKEGYQPGFRVKKFKEGAEEVFPALFVPDPEHPETKIKRTKFMKAAAKYMDGLFHRHTQKILEKKMEKSETSCVGRSAVVKDICESNSQSTCYENIVNSNSDEFVEDKHEQVTSFPEIFKEKDQVDNENYICCETKDKLTGHNKYDERQNSSSDSSGKVESENRENYGNETEEMLNRQEKNGKRQIHMTDNSKRQGLIDQCKTTGVINKTAEDESEIGKKIHDCYLEVTSKMRDNNQETCNVNEYQSLYTDCSIKYSAKSVSGCARKMTSSKGTSITSVENQKPYKKMSLDNDASFSEINELETVEGRLTRARKRIICQKQESVDVVSHLEKPVQNFAKENRGDASIRLLKKDKTFVRNKMATEETRRVKDIKSEGDNIQSKCRRTTRQSSVNFDLETSLNNFVAEFSENGLKEKQQQQVKVKKKQKYSKIKYTDKQYFDQSIKNEKQGNACMSNCVTRMRENRKNTRNPMPLSSKRRNENTLGLNSLHISDCYVKLKKIRLLDDAVTLS